MQRNDIYKKKSGMVTCEFNPSAGGVEQGRSLHLRGQLASSTHLVPDQ